MPRKAKRPTKQVQKKTKLASLGIGTEEAVRGRLNEIGVELERATHDSDVDALRERRARLSSRLAVVRVGGATAVETKERLRRTEGSLSAARA